MERAQPHPEADEHAHPAPVPRDPDLPAVSDATLMLVAAAALVAAATALLLVTR